MDLIQYGYDEAGELTSKTDAAGASNTYTYDQAGRLSTWAQKPAGSGTTTTTDYAYDADGNRIQVGANVYTYDARDELTSDGQNTYTYTPNGDLSQISRSTQGGEQNTAYTDDAYGQQVDAGAQTYTYDASGRVLSEGAGSTTIDMQYSGAGNDVAQAGLETYSRDPGGDLVGQNTSGSPASSGQLLWTDLHTDVVGAFTSTGTAMSGVESYDPLGKVLTDTGTMAAVNLGYQSEFTDSATGEVNMDARWYNPATGQFLDKDSVSNSATPDTANANPFAYAGGDPLTNVDPSGHMYFSNGQGTLEHTPAKFVHAVEANNARYGLICEITGSAAPDAYEWQQAEDVLEEAQRIADVKAAPLPGLGGGRFVVGGGGVGSATSDAITSLNNQISGHIGNIAQEENQQAAAAEAAEQHQQCGWTHIGGCIHNAAVAIGKNSVLTAVVSAVAAIGTGLGCLAATAGAGSVACLAAASAVGNSVQYALSATASGTFSWNGLAASAEIGAVSGLAAAATGGAALGLLGLDAAAASTLSIGTRAALGGLEGLVGGAVAGAGNYANTCGTSCSWGGLAESTAMGGAMGALGGAVGVVGGEAVSSATSAVRSAFSNAGEAAADDAASAAAAAGGSSAESGDAPAAAAAAPAEGGAGADGGDAADAGDGAGASAGDDNGGSGNASCCSCAPQSFTGSTPVLMADGSTKPIGQVEVGDVVANSVPGASGVQDHTVTALEVTYTDRDFVDVTVAPVTGSAADAGTTLGLAHSAVGSQAKSAAGSAAEASSVVKRASVTLAAGIGALSLLLGSGHAAAAARPAPSATATSSATSFATATATATASAAASATATAIAAVDESGGGASAAIPGGGTGSWSRDDAPPTPGARQKAAQATAAETQAAERTGGGTITTTFLHPFYDQTQSSFVEAQYLHVGDLVQTTTGTARITGLHLFHADTTTYDLTIGALHTFYVVAGSTSVLVHNVNAPCPEVGLNDPVNGAKGAHSSFDRPGGMSGTLWLPEAETPIDLSRVEETCPMGFPGLRTRAVSITTSKHSRLR